MPAVAATAASRAADGPRTTNTTTAASTAVEVRKVNESL
jgi:hypothetical protein